MGDWIYYAIRVAERVRLLFTVRRISMAEVKILSFRTDSRFITFCFGRELIFSHAE